MHSQGLSALLSALANGDCSSVELTRHFLARIERLNTTYNCFITVCEEQALAMAEAADASRRAGRAGPLCGLPIAHKDLFCTEGVRTSCASRMLANYVPPYDATVVSRLAAAGAVMLGKTNMDEFAMGSSCEHSIFGPTRNPWALDCVPGGSSGGSAAAVAAGLCAAATGTDTGGSIRQPAALCGVTGLKPSYGRVSRYGMVAFASSLDQAGPLTRSAEDAALMLGAMAGPDRLDSTCALRSAEDYSALLERPPGKLRLGLVREWQHEASAAGEVVRAAAAEFEGLGHTLTEVSLPHAELGLSVYYVLAPAECSSNLSRYDGIRYGHRSGEAGDLKQLLQHSRSEGFGAEVQRRILIGTYVLSEGYYDDYYLHAQRVRRLIQQDFDRAFEQVDVLLGPAAPGPCFPIGERLDDPLRLYREDLYTIPASLAGLPALALPAGEIDGRPLGLQLIGRYFDEGRLLNLGHCFQQQTDWHLRLPPVPASSGSES